MCALWKQNEIYHGNHSPARVTVWSPKRVKLFQLGCFQASFFFQLAPCPIIQTLIHLDKPTWQGPHANKGFSSALDQ
jgi:hypothetical protein